MCSGFESTQESRTQTLKKFFKCLETKPESTCGVGGRQNRYGKVMRKWKRDFSLTQLVLMVNVVLRLARVTCSSGFSGSESAKDNWCIKSSAKVPRSLCSGGGKGWSASEVHCPGEIKVVIQNSCMKATFPIDQACLEPLLLLVQIVLFQKMRLANE